MIDHDFKPFPSELKTHESFLTWKREKNLTSPGHDKKPPIDPKTGKKVSPTDPATWMSFKTAIKHYDNGGVEVWELPSRRKWVLR